MNKGGLITKDGRVAKATHPPLTLQDMVKRITTPHPVRLVLLQDEQGLEHARECYPGGAVCVVRRLGASVQDWQLYAMGEQAELGPYTALLPIVGWWRFRDFEPTMVGGYTYALAWVFHVEQKANTKRKNGTQAKHYDPPTDAAKVAGIKGSQGGAFDPW